MLGGLPAYGGAAQSVHDGISIEKTTSEKISSGPLLRVLMLMAMADGDLATEEKAMLDKLSKE